eukprot:TRINITY_DN6495_c0_g1_i1.p1 TRINITY_DN6495_c0_g1~~TRINITY_DN6495_c0_g1_i1.p1  ORF type:complete len:441 (+),score=62.53 TRINITY_DN6495_c0_g1_i1:52-1374(+)
MATYPSYQKWLVLLAFSFNTCCNSFMFMNISTVEDVTEAVWGSEEHPLSDGTLNWLYSASLLAVLPYAFPASYLLSRKNTLITGMGVVCNVSGAWLRYISAVTGSYGVALASSILIGLSAAVIITSVSHVPGTWFRKEERSLATSIGVQANYSGWCAGAVLLPYLVSTPDDFKKLMLIQALIVSCSLVLFVLFHREAPPGVNGDEDVKDEEAQEDEGEKSIVPQTGFFSEFIYVMKHLWSSKFFVCQLAIYSAIGGISFAIPAVQGEVFDSSDNSISFSDHETAWTNFAFVFSGVVGGLLFGAFIKKQYINIFLSICFVVCSISLTLIVVVSHLESHFSKDTVYAMYLVLMGLSGVTSLGFIGPALSRACSCVHPISHSWSGGAVEWWIQVFGAILTQISTSFIYVAVLSWVATIGWVLSNAFVASHEDGTAEENEDLLN